MMESSGSFSILIRTPQRLCLSSRNFAGRLGPKVMLRRHLAYRAVFSILVSLVWITGVSSQRAVAQTSHRIQISTDADDGYYNNQNGTGWHSTSEYGSADLVGSWGGTTTAWVTGYRFPSTGINSGDTIQSAYLQLVSSDSNAAQATCGSAPCSNTTSTFRVYGVLQDDGPAFSGVAGNTPLDVPYTNAYTDYTTTGPGDVAGSCQGRLDYGQNSCTHVIDVTSIVREITSQPGWTSTSAIRFVMLSTNPSGPNAYAGFEDYSANPAKAATLSVNPPLPTIVSSGAWGSSAAPTYPTTVPVGPFVYPGASTLLFFLGDYYDFPPNAPVPIPQPAVTDNCGNNWQVLAGPANWAGIVYDMRTTVYYVQNPASCPAGDQITVTINGQEPIFTHFLAVAGSNTPVASTINSPNPGTYTSVAPTDSVPLGSSGLLISWIFGDADPPNNGISNYYIFTPAAGYATDLNSTPNYLTAASENVVAGTYQTQFAISGGLHGTDPSGVDGTDGWQNVLIGLQAAGTSSNPPVITSSSSANATVGQAFSYQIAATNSPTSYSATGLPSGLSVNSSTGRISGNPTASGTSMVGLSATNASGTGTATLTLTIAAAATPVITSATTASGTVGSSFSYQIAATNSPTSYNATGLPSGLSVNSSTGLISGTPIAAGGWTATLSATNASGTGTATLTITIAAAVAPSIVFVQESAKAATATAKSLSVSFAANTLPGDLILVAFDFASSATPKSITDSQGNTFTQVGTQLVSPGGSASRVYYAKSIKGGADTVTVALSANSAWIEVYLTEYSGVDPTNPIDAQAGAAGSAGAVSSGTAKTSYPGDVIVGYCPADWSCTVGSGFAARSTFNNNLIEDAMAASPGSYAATASANNGWTMQMVALKPAP
jgi:Putative Ig domain